MAPLMSRFNRVVRFDLRRLPSARDLRLYASQLAAEHLDALARTARAGRGATSKTSAARRSGGGTPADRAGRGASAPPFDQYVEALASSASDPRTGAGALGESTSSTSMP